MRSLTNGAKEMTGLTLSRFVGVSEAFRTPLRPPATPHGPNRKTGTAYGGSDPRFSRHLLVGPFHIPPVTFSRKSLLPILQDTPSAYRRKGNGYRWSRFLPRIAVGSIARAPRSISHRLRTRTAGRLDTKYNETRCQSGEKHDEDLGRQPYMGTPIVSNAKYDDCRGIVRRLNTVRKATGPSAESSHFYNPISNTHPRSSRLGDGKKKLKCLGTGNG